MSVNVSIAQIRQARFELEVEQILLDTRLPPSVLCLEITESLFADTSLVRVQTVLESLKGVGVKLAIDDFGTGYSSLSYLNGLPFDELKIDRAFVSGIGSNASKHRLLKGMIELSHALDLTVIAEGAETQDEVNVLREMGAEQVQGYVYSRPVTAAEIPALTQSLKTLYLEQFRLLSRAKAGAPSGVSLKRQSGQAGPDQRRANRGLRRGQGIGPDRPTWPTRSAP